MAKHEEKIRKKDYQKEGGKIRRKHYWKEDGNTGRKLLEEKRRKVAKYEENIRSIVVKLKEEII